MNIPSRRISAIPLTVSLLLGLVPACGNDPENAPTPTPIAATTTPVAASVQATSSKAFNPRLLRRFAPVRALLPGADGAPTEAQITLGKMLYFDKRLSKNKDVSCNSCHKLDAYGVDGEATSKGDKGQRGGRNSPTVYHAAGSFVQFWDGRASNVEEQAKGPVLNPVEMAMPDGKSVVTRLKSISGYKAPFEQAFPGQAEPVTFDNVARAIGAFERKLTTPARWDDYLRGNAHALTATEMEGLKIFTNVGCMVCHTGEFLGGTSYQRVGAVEPWPNQADQGRFAVTKNPADKMMFKVPTLRNIERTAPYFHDGSAKTLPEAVRMMGKHQLGLELGDDEVSSIVAWLHSLTGELPKDLVAEPTLPLDGKSPT